MRPVVNTEKHLVQFSLAAVASGAISNLEILNAVASPSANNEIRIGAVVSAIYVEMWVQSDDAAAGTAIVTLERVDGNVTAFMTAGNSANLNAYENKKNIIHTQMGLIPNNVTYPMVSVKGWFKIPKGKQRFGADDKFMMNIHGQSNGLSFCGIAIFKEQF